jgi:ligand-binding sensor domain-containing protein/serine phosphatase RsbU (regulator of sigma subunit)/ABC-type amino acid transport substrate-binding protein
MNRSKLCLFLALIICPLALQARSLEEIKKSGKIYVGFTTSDYKNINYPLALEFAKYLNVKMVSLTIDWEDAFSQGGKVPADIETNPDLRYTPDAFHKVDIICSTFSMVEWRKKLFDFARTLYSAELLIIDRNADLPRDYSQLNGKTIAFMKGTTFETHMHAVNKEAGNHIILKPVNSDDDSKKLLLEGKVYGIILDADEALNFNAQNNGRFQIAFPISPASNSAWAVEKNNNLRLEVEDFFETIEVNGVLDKIFSEKFQTRYSSFVQKIKKNSKLQVYHRDLDEIIHSKKLVVAFRDRNFVFKEGEQKQFMHALAEEFADHLGVKLEYLITPTLSKYFENDKGVIIKDSSYTPDWFNYFDVACEMFAPLDWRTNKIDMVPIYPSEYTVVAMKKTNLSSIHDMHQLRGVINKGSVYEDILQKNAITNFYYANVDSFLTEVNSGRADYAILYNAFFELSEFPDLEMKFSLGDINVCWGLRKDQPKLKKELEKFINASKNDGLLGILLKAMQGKTLQSPDDFINSYFESFQTGQLPYVLYGAQDGLPQEDIFSIFQDNRGYMWFGTNAGAVRYNGREMKVYDITRGLINNTVMDIDQDSSGIIYFSTSRGVALLMNDSVMKTIFPDKSFTNIRIDSKSNKWFYGDNGIAELDNEGKEIDFSAINTELFGKIIDMESDRKGNGKFFATPRGVYYYSFTNKGLRKVLEDECYAIFLDSNDSIWYSTRDGIFIRSFRELINGGNHTVARKLNKTIGVSNVIIKQILQGKYGSVWLLSDLQIYQVISTDQKAIIYEKEIGLKNNTILSILEDAENNLWIGFSGGLQRLTNKKGLRNFFPNTLNSNIYSIHEDRRGRIWIASNNGLYYYENDLVNFNRELSIRNERCIAGNLPGGDVLVANSHSMFILNGDNLGFTRERTFTTPLENLENVFISSRGEIFLLTGLSGKVYYLSDFYAEPVLIQNHITANLYHLAEAGGVIYGGNSAGIIVFDNKQFRLEKDLDCNVWTLIWDDDKLWVGSDCGLGTYINGEYSPVNFTTRTNVVVKAIYPARNRNYLWLGTNAGVIYFNKTTGSEEFSIDSKDGLSGDEITVEGLFVDSRGLLWIGTYHGISNYNVRASSNRSYSPLCYIEQILLNGKEIDVQNNRVFRHNENNLVFEISGLSYADEQSIEYEFYLRGMENDYSSYNKGKEFKAYYSNLLPGKYEFVYRAKGKNNVWGYAQKFQFTIKKAWYDTWVFRIFVLFVVCFCVWTFYKIRLKSIEQQKKRLEKLVKERTRELEEANAEIEAQRDLATQQRDQISQQKKEITDSIHYAKRIQSSVLPSTTYLKLLLPEHFILFKPRDIVSGDFYWITENDGKPIVTAADCTGHGVPGAFMSLLGIAFLNEIVNKSPHLSAGEILDQLRKYIIKSLHQKGLEGESKDGMDMTLCIFDLPNKSVQFAGANNPLYLIRDGQLLEYKGDKMPVSIHEKMAAFTTHQIQVRKGDVMYLFSDGYADQFGGPGGKKFMYKALKELLLQIHGLPMKEQKETATKRFEEWKGEFDQVDDVVILGIRI